MHLYSQALTTSLALSLTRLHLNNCGSHTSGPMMKIPSSCPHLVHVRCTGPLDAREILGIDRDKATRMTGRTGRTRWIGRQYEEQPLPESIHPPEWACKNLQILEIAIRGLQYTGWQRAVLLQLAKLRQLRVLDVDDYTDILRVRSQDGVAFSLMRGLGILSSLTLLERLGFYSLHQEMTKQDIEWMIKTWPRLSSVCGWVHHSDSERIELEKIFKRHGIAVERLRASFKPSNSRWKMDLDVQAQLMPLCSNLDLHSKRDHSSS